MPITPVDPGVWINTILNNILNKLVWPIFFGASIIMFIFAGFMFLTSQGDLGKIETAKKAVLFAIIGIIVVIIGFSATAFITNIFAPPPASPGNSLSAGQGACCNVDSCFIGVAGQCVPANGIPFTFHLGEQCDPNPCQ